jgi:hypothetical protein
MEVDRPQAVIGFLQTDLLIGERIGDVEKRLRDECAVPATRLSPFGPPFLARRAATNSAS